MDFKIEIKCMKCRCVCELRPENFIPRETFECPNCGQPMPTAIYDKLKSGVISLGDVPEQIPERKDAFLVQPVDFELKVKEYSKISDILTPEN